ncbi:MAG: hypothetical protein AB7V32_05385, partial [Candidatus Berkiella sp.]
MQLPSLSSTLIRTFRLYIKSFALVLPLILGLMLGKYLLNVSLGQSHEMDLAFFIKIIGDIACSAIFFSIMVNIIDAKYKQLNKSYLSSLLNGSRRFTQVFIIYFLMSSPILLILLLIEIGYAFWVPYVITQSVAQILLYGSLTAIGFGMLITTTFFVMGFLSGIFSAIHNENFYDALKHSWKIVKPYWLDTLLLLVILGMINVSLDLLFDALNVPYIYLF